MSMEYKEGLVAFIDILGFSQYVMNESNKEKVRSLFQFVEKFCYLFNCSPELAQNVSFFSDSIVLATDNLYQLSISISIAESYLKDNLELLFRGGITHGKYYYENNVMFGPAVIAAHNLETKANYSRVLIDPVLNIAEEPELLAFTDLDGYSVFNPYCLILNHGCRYGGDDRVVYPEDPTLNLERVFSQCRNEIIEKIQQYNGNPVVEKYLWRIRPYNYTCNTLLRLPDGEVLYDKINYKMNKDLREILQKSIIDTDCLGL